VCSGGAAMCRVLGGEGVAILFFGIVINRNVKVKEQKYRKFRWNEWSLAGWVGVWGLAVRGVRVQGELCRGGSGCGVGGWREPVGELGF
jgi:hypothetical protein